MKVFLSHSSADKELARRLARDLTGTNIDVWLDEWEIRIGEVFAQKIEEALEEVEFVIVLLTRASVASEWVTREWRHKFQHEIEAKRVAIVPVRGEPCDMPDFLAQRSHADISGGSYLLGVRHLLTILGHYSEETAIRSPAEAMERHETRDMLWIVAPIGLEVSGDLVPLLEMDGAGHNRVLHELAPRMRESLQGEFGFPFPGIVIRVDDTDLRPGSALVYIDEVPEVMLEVRRDDVLVDADAEYLFLGVHAVVRRMAQEFVDIDVTRRLVDSIEATSPDLVLEGVPKAVSWFELTDVLRRLVAEEIGIGDLKAILEALSPRMPDWGDTVMLTERVRHALSRQITAKFLRGADALPVLLLDPEVETAIGSAIHRTPVGAHLNLAPELSQDILAAVRASVGSVANRAGGAPILVSGADVRPFVRKLVSLEFPALHVLSRQDVMPATPIEAIARIHLTRTGARATPAGDGAPA